MASKEDTLAKLDELNAKVDAQEQRGLAQIAAKDQAITDLNALIAELQARPEVPDDVTAKLQTVADNLDNNFTAAAPVEQPASEG